MNPKTTTPPTPGARDLPGLATLREVERLRTVYQLADAVSRARGLGEIYEAALLGLERALGTTRASILLYDADRVMRFKAWHGLSDRYRAAVEGHSPWSPEAVDPEPVLVTDVTQDPAVEGYRDLFASEGIRALGFIPLLSRDRLIGKFMVYFDRPHRLDAEELQLARTIASHVAFAVARQRDDEKLALYREIFAHSSEAIAIIDAGGRYVEQNAAHRSLVGYDDPEIQGKTPAIHLGEERFAEIAGALGAQGVYRSDVISTTKAGMRRHIELSAFTVRDQTGVPVCYVGIKRDITERKRVEEALQFLAGASAALDRSLDVDATLEKLASLTVPDLGDWVVIETLGEDDALHPAVVNHADPRRQGSLTLLLERRASSGATESSNRALASLRPVRIAARSEFLGDLLRQDPSAGALLDEVGAQSAIAAPLRARGRVLGVMTIVSGTRVFDEREVALLEDLARRGATALDNARLYREAQESDRRKEEFLAVLAHELRNPMTPLLTCLELMRGGRADASSLQRWREIMERQVRNLSRLVDDLLDVSRITRGKIELQKESVDVATVVARAVETTRALIESRRLALRVSVQPDLRLEADPLRLEQILSNLLNNAAKYTPEGGAVDVIAERDGDTVRLRVRDNGVGIAPDLLPRLFELFLQGGRSSSGLGIGLTLVRTLVELHGGSVRASSAGPGLGSEFEVGLPVGAPVTAAASRPGRARELEPRGRARALVVDDNMDAAALMGEALRLRGHEVYLAHDGRTALELAARHAPDLVFLDLGLPDLDGYEVASRLRTEPGLERTALIAISGYGQEQYRNRSAAAGFSFHIVKPIDLDQLDAILRATASAKGQDPARSAPAS